MNIVQTNSYNPNFGMPIRINKNAHNVLKNQTYHTSEIKYNGIWNELNKLVEEQEENPVLIEIRKCKHRKALSADVFDNADDPMKPITYSQRLIKPFGLKFLRKAIKSADNINDINKKLEQLPTTEIADV